MSASTSTEPATHPTMLQKQVKELLGGRTRLGGAISWKSTTQKLTALSSTEAELYAIDDASRELRHLHMLLEDFNIDIKLPTRIAQDNMSTISLVGSRHWNPRTKHVALRYHHTGDLQRAGTLKVQYLSTGEMPADVLTKPLGGGAHTKHAQVLLGLASLQFLRPTIQNSVPVSQQQQQQGRALSVTIFRN